MTIIGAAENKD